MKRTILVTAANGNTGYPAAKELLKLGFAVRAFVRNSKTAKARDLEQSGAELFVGDMEDIRDVREALVGVESAYFVPTYPNVLLQGNTFATAAEESKLNHVVVVTQWLSSPDHFSQYTREHWLVDQCFKRLSHTKVITLGPGLFAFTYFMATIPLAQFGMLADTGKNAPPSSEDIGLVAAHILKAPETHAGKSYRITSDQLLTSAQMALIIGKVLGRKVKAVELPEKLLIKVLRAYGFPKTDISQVRYYMREGHFGSWHINAPTKTVEQIVGKKADNFESIVRRYLLPQPMAKQTLGNKFKAMVFMLRVMLTPAWDMEKFEKEQGFSQFKNRVHATQSEIWKARHTT